MSDTDDDWDPAAAEGTKKRARPQSFAIPTDWVRCAARRGFGAYSGPHFLSERPQSF